MLPAASPERQKRCNDRNAITSGIEALKILDDQIAGRVRRPVHKLLMSSELVERGSA